MKRFLLTLVILASSLTLSTELTAQVTVGDNKPPVAGAILQLQNQDPSSAGDANATKGLGLPRVELLALTTSGTDLAATIKDAIPSPKPSDYVEWKKDEHTGLVVYNTVEKTVGTDKIIKGMYVWNGEKWESLSANETP